MAQADGVVANGTGSAVRTDINNQYAALWSNHSGSTEPSSGKVAFQTWADTNSGYLKIRNAANNAWIQLFKLDGTLSDIPVEGTVIKSTGESGGTKFLREDGDGTCSWQAPSGGTTLSGSTNNTITTVTSANNIQGEANLTFDGSTLDFNQGNNSNNTANGNIDFSNSDTDQVARITGYTGSSSDDGNLRFYTKNGGTETEALRISEHATPKLQMLGGETEIVSSASDGSLTLKADPGQNRSASSVMFDVDATVRGRFTSDGLCFNSDTAAANALSDYEEGSFTPGLSNGGTLTVYSCRYTKIGREVTIHAYFYVQSVPDDGNNFLITGLPFSITSDTSAIAGGCWSYGGNLTDAYKMAPSGSPGGSVANFYWLDGANSGGVLQNNSFDGSGPTNTRYIGFKLFYYTD